MTINAVQMFAKTTLDGLDLGPLYPNLALTAYVAPPVPGEIITPTAYIWGAHINGNRLAGARFYGFKKFIYDLQVYLVEIADPADDAADQAFPTAIDAVMRALWTVPIVQTITDPTTGTLSHIEAIGEKFTVTYDTVRTLRDQRYVRNLALITTPVEESMVG